MNPPSPDLSTDGAVLSAAVKALRKLRQFTAAQTAERMHLNSRTYERFESGQTRLNMDYIKRFARAVDCDPHAIVTAIAIGWPEFAVYCASNQLSSILTVGLQDLGLEVGDDLRFLTARDIFEISSPMFMALTERAREAKRQAAITQARMRPDPPAD
ncbi:hypothetical protein LTR94_026345 [Friedmanniomyces endolithicus]|nr:hypothetical protein LTR94_026345 [Friedmanniomyces endolithicus]